MAPEDDSRKRWREREDEREAEEVEKITKKSGLSSDPKLSKGSSAGPESSKLDDLISRAEPLIEQLNNLYQRYSTGVERLPPNERRLQLDQLMASIQMMSKPTPAVSFRANSIQSRYITNRERWDRMLKDLESGKIKKIVGGKR